MCGGALFKGFNIADWPVMAHSATRAFSACLSLLETWKISKAMDNMQ